VTRGYFMLLAVAVCVGCGTPPVKTRYFALATEHPESAARNVAGLRVTLGPASVPEAVDRRQMVLRIAPGQDDISDANGWTTPLKHAIPRAVADVIAARLPAVHVAVYPQHTGQDGDYRLEIDVQRFESAPGKACTLDVVWRVRSASGELLREAAGTYVVPVATSDIEAVVVAHRKALATLGDEIAAALGELMAARRVSPRSDNASGVSLRG